MVAKGIKKSSRSGPDWPDFDLRRLRALQWVIAGLGELRREQDCDIFIVIEGKGLEGGGATV